MPASLVNLPQEVVNDIKVAPEPKDAVIHQLRSGKVEVLGNEKSGIFKRELFGRVYVNEMGIVGDEHVFRDHGGVERALHQYPSEHYPDWRDEKPPHPDLLQPGGFGENLVGTGMNEENVCIGDIFQIGEEVIVQISEPRAPCSKLNVRFEWPRALKRIQRTGRVGWNMRVLKSGYIQAGDEITLQERPNPKWSCMNVKRVIQGKSVPLPLLVELSNLEVMTERHRQYARSRLLSISKRYRLSNVTDITSRVKQFTLELAEPFKLSQPQFEEFGFAQIEFGPDLGIKRSYSVVSGDQNIFSLGISLDDNSRGGSAYLHRELKVGDEIRMTPGASPKAEEDEKKCAKEACVASRVVVIGGIGVTAFLPVIRTWTAEKVPFEVHYAVRSLEDAAFLDELPADKTTVYAKSRGERLNLQKIVPAFSGDEPGRKIYCCGPIGLMDACQRLTTERGYPEHMVHFESFGADAGGLRGDPFEADVEDIYSGKKGSLTISADKSLLQVLKESGFDMTSFCETGGCGACKVFVCNGDVIHKGTGLKAREKANNMLSCVDRAVGKIKIELD